MKANEAPENIYVHRTPYLGLLAVSEINITGDDIEYTRTDAFIEKAVRFLKEWDAYRVCLEGHKDWFIEQFKNYMEGE